MAVDEYGAIRVEIAIPLNQKNYLAICDLKDALLNEFGGLTYSIIANPFDDDGYQEKLPFHGMWVNLDKGVIYDEKVVNFTCYIDYIKYHNWREKLDTIANDIIIKTKEDAVSILYQQGNWLLYY